MMTRTRISLNLASYYVYLDQLNILFLPLVLMITIASSGQSYCLYPISQTEIHYQRLNNNFSNGNNITKAATKTEKKQGRHAADKGAKRPADLRTGKADGSNPS